MNCPDQTILRKIFPEERTNNFFDALYGGAEEGAYNIYLVCINIGEEISRFAFELRRREGQCLKCSLTHGLPSVFARHPVINLSQVARELAEYLGYIQYSFELLPVEEISEALHIIPLIIKREHGR